MKATVLVRRELVELRHLSEVLVFVSQLNILFQEKFSFDVCFRLFLFFYLKSSSSAIRDLGSRSSSRRKDGLVCCMHVCESMIYLCVKYCN